MIRILIADDHPDVREGVRQVLAKCTDLAVTDEAVDGPEALKKARSGVFDLLVLDIAMPGMSGLEVLRRIKREQPDLPVVILSLHAESEFVARALRLGAVAYLTKGTPADKLEQAIRDAAAGVVQAGPFAAGMPPADGGRETSQPLHSNLSDREHEVLLAIAAGKKLAQIARDLSLSVKTVTTHRSSLLRRLRMRSNAELMRYAIREELIE